VAEGEVIGHKAAKIMSSKEYDIVVVSISCHRIESYRVYSGIVRYRKVHIHVVTKVAST